MINLALYARVVAGCDIRVPGEHELVISDDMTDNLGGKLRVVEPKDIGMLIEHGLLVARPWIGGVGGD